MALNPMGKSRPASNPYLTIEHAGWTWRVLKAYSANPDAPYARWFCAVSSPMLSRPDDMELGDTYISEIRGRVTGRDSAVPDSALPAHLR
jgi:hypothetical protein